MNFESENVLIKTFLRQPLAFFKRVTGLRLNRYFVLREFDSGFGVADIVLGSFVPYLSVRYLRETIDPNWAGALVDAQTIAPFTVDDFSDRFGVTQQTSREKLNQFMEAGFLRSSQNKYWNVKHYGQAVGTSIAIEAKLKNWQHALLQARRYRRFANFSFVLLDKQHSRPAEANIKHFVEHNVGLISMTGAKHNIHYLPTRTESNVNINFYKFNETVYKAFKNSYGDSLKRGSK